MGNLEKVLIVIILATIAVITALAFLDSGDSLETDAAVLDDSTSGEEDGTANEAASSLSEILRRDRPGDDEEGVPSADERNHPLDEQDDVLAEEDNGLESVSDPETTTGGTAAGGDDSRPVSSLRGDPEPTDPESSDKPTDDELSPVTLKRDTQGGTQEKPISRTVAGGSYTPGARGYRTVAGDTWRAVAALVYGDADLAEALRATNTDVLADETLPAGTTLFILPRAELEKEVALPGPDRAAPSRSTRRHTVKNGETLSEISRQYYGSTIHWRDILEANSDILTTDRDLRPNQVLTIPPKPR